MHLGSTVFTGFWGGGGGGGGDLDKNNLTDIYYVCVNENSPRFDQIAFNKRSIIEISQGSMLCSVHGYHSPPMIHTVSFAPLPLGQKTERNPNVPHILIDP